MDNGQQRQVNPNGQSVDGFLTGGNNMNQANNDVLDPNANPGTNADLSTDWNQPIERDQKKIGGNVIASSNEVLPPSPETGDVELGKIMNLEMPPGHQEEENPSTTEKNELSPEALPKENETADVTAFRAERDHISSATLNLTLQAIRSFESGKLTPAELNDYVWEAKKAYAKNSFGRELEEGSPVIPGADKEVRKGIPA